VADPARAGGSPGAVVEPLEQKYAPLVLGGPGTLAPVLAALTRTIAPVLGKELAA
jgi:hypothetical protein